MTLTGIGHTIDTESDASSDDLDTINAGPINEGQVIHVWSENVARTVTVRHAQGGAGQVHFDGEGKRELSTTRALTLQRKGTDWYEFGACSPVDILSYATASAAASIDFTAPAGEDWTDYVGLLLIAEGILPSTDLTNLHMQTSTDRGSTWDAAAGYTYHARERIGTSDTEAISRSGAAAQIGLIRDLSSTASEGGQLWLMCPATNTGCSISFNGMLVMLMARELRTRA